MAVGTKKSNSQVTAGQIEFIGKTTVRISVRNWLIGVDWFILAVSEERAEFIHEEFEGYDDGDAQAQFVAKIPDGLVTEPGHPSAEVLIACGAKIIRAETPRLVEIDGKRYIEGMLQHQILSIDDNKFEAKGMGRPNRTTRLKKS